MLDWLLSNIYEICIGIGLIITTIFNRRKPTADEIKAKNERIVLKLEKKISKKVSNLQDDVRKVEELRQDEIKKGG